MASEAAFGSHDEKRNPTCLHNTRVDLLDSIYTWIQDPTVEAMFWLNGRAGTGKSTISRTLVNKAPYNGYLGASFFFKRGESDRGNASKFFTTIAAQLASQNTTIAQHIQAAIDTDRRSPVDMDMREQFRKLIFEPLSKASKDFPKGRTLLIVVDALDECDSNDVKSLIDILSSSKDMQHPRLKIFLTSRPDLPVNCGFTNVEGSYQHLILHEVPDHIIKHDIEAFFIHEMEQIRTSFDKSVAQHRHLPPKWPGMETIRILADMAVPLFIFAATVCRFIVDRRGGGPTTQLQKVLEHRTKNEGSSLSATYLPVLEQMTDGLRPKEKDATLGDFRHIVGSIVVLADPLSASALARLLDVDPEKVWEKLDWLHSVLSIPRETELPIKPFHLSFRDFLLDQTSSTIFSVNEADTHKRLATDCLQTMQASLPLNICGREQPGVLLTEVEPQRISDALRPEIQYACRYWVYHLVQSQTKLSDDSEAYSFLTTHFLHWLEALSWTRRASESLIMLDALQDHIDVSTK